MSTLPTRDEPAKIVRSAGPGARLPIGLPPGGGVTGRDILLVLRKRKWMIFVTAMIVIGATSIATLLWAQYAPFYTAKAYLAVEPPKGSELSIEPRAQMPADAERHKLTHVQMIMSVPVLQRAAEMQTLTQTNWYAVRRADIIAELRDAIDISPIRQTNLISLSMTSTAPTDRHRIELAEVVTAVAQAYVEDTSDAAKLGRERHITRLEDERNDMEKKLAAKREQLGTTRGDMDIPMLYEKRSVLTIRIQALTREVMQLELAQAQAKSSLQAVEEQRESGVLAQSPEVIALVDQNADFANLRNTLQFKNRSLENALNTYGPQHRVIESLKAEIGDLEKNVVAKEKEATIAAMDAVLQQRQGVVLAITSRLLQVRAKFDEESAGFKDLQETIDKMAQYTSEATVLGDRIRRIESTLVELRVLYRGEAPVTLRRPATEPTEVSMPRWSVMLPLGSLLGLVLGLLLSFFVEFMDTSIKSPADVARRVDLPLLGMVPHLEDLDEDIDEVALAFKTHPDSLISEAFRQIRTCLFFSGPPSERRTLLVTSPLPEDGRTTVAVNLGGVIAQSGMKVLVVDANFHQPRIHMLFPETSDDGLSSVLVGRGDWRELVHEVEPNLSVMPAGPLPPNPTELMGSPQMRTVIEEMAEAYDQVLIDAAPCMVVTDPSVISTLVDGVLLVVRAGANTHGIVQRSKDMFLRLGAHITGITLNGVRTVSGGYLRKNYETFYEYRVQEQLPVG